MLAFGIIILTVLVRAIFYSPFYLFYPHANGDAGGTARIG